MHFFRKTPAFIVIRPEKGVELCISLKMKSVILSSTDMIIHTKKGVRIILMSIAAPARAATAGMKQRRF